MSTTEGKGKLDLPKANAAFYEGLQMGQIAPTKMEQRFSPGTVGNSKYMENRRLSPAEREGLVPVVGDWKKAPVKRKV